MKKSLLILLLLLTASCAPYYPYGGNYYAPYTDTTITKELPTFYTDSVGFSSELRHQERQHFSRKLKWGSSDFSSEKCWRSCFNIAAMKNLLEINYT
jgi:hypothetical protein